MYSFGNPSDISTTVHPISTEILVIMPPYTCTNGNAGGIGEIKTAHIVRSHNDMSNGLKSGDLGGQRYGFHGLSI